MDAVTAEGPLAGDHLVEHAARWTGTVGVLRLRCSPATLLDYTDDVGQVFKIGSKSDCKIVSARNWPYGHKDNSGSLASEEEDKSRAQEWREAYFGVRVGHLEVEDVDEGDLTSGLMAGLRFHRYLGFAAALDYHDSEFSLENRATLALTLGLEVHFLKPKVAVQPYGVAGVGYYYAQVEREDEFGNILIDDVDSKAGFHYGAGLDVVVRREGDYRLAINLETRRIFTDPEENDETEPDGFQLTVGLKLGVPPESLTSS